MTQLVLAIVIVTILVVMFVEIRLEQLYKTIIIERHEKVKWLCEKIAECAYVNDVDRLSKELDSFEAKVDERLMKMNDLNQRITTLENIVNHGSLLSQPDLLNPSGVWYGGVEGTNVAITDGNTSITSKKVDEFNTTITRESVSFEPNTEPINIEDL